MTGDSDGEAMLQRRLPILGEETNEQVIERTWSEIKGLDHSSYTCMTVVPIFSPPGISGASKITFQKIDGRIQGRYEDAKVWVS